MTPTILEIKLKVCEVFGIEMADLMSRAKPTNIAMPRLVAYYLCKTYTGHSNEVIGREFHRDHSTVIVGRRRIFKIKEKYPAEVAALVVHFHKLKNRPTLHLNWPKSEQHEKVCD